MKAAGAALVLIGFLGLLFGGIPYDRKETVARIGDFKMEATEKRELGLPAPVNGLLILAGTALWLRAGSKPDA